VLDVACARLAPALSARSVEWRPVAEAASSSKGSGSRGLSRSQDPALTVCVLTSERPDYEIRVGDLSGGRRLLSDDEELANAIGAIAARRIDAVRLTSERYELRVREEEMQKLAAEAELKALRAQINPVVSGNSITRFFTRGGRS
jgi:hypothetical protein